MYNQQFLNFIKESVDELHEFDVKSYKYAHNLIFEGVPAGFAEMPILTDGADGVSIITAALNDLNKVSAENTEPLVSFYNKVNGSTLIGNSNIVITIPNLGEIDKIRPQFLLAEAKGISENIAKFLRGDFSASELMYQVEKLSIANSKRNISKTILDTGKDITYLARQVEGENVSVDGNFIKTRIIPFLATYPATQSSLSKEASAVISAINDSTMIMTQVIAAVNSSISSMDKLKALKISNYLYKIVRKYIELRSYTAFIMTRKILNYTHTMLQYYNLYTMLVGMFPEGSRVLHENVIDGELSIDVEDYDLIRDMQSGNGSLVDTKIEAILNRRSADIATVTRQISGTDALNQIGVSFCDYDKELYDAVKSIFTSFTSRITDFKNAIMNGEIFDDAQEHTGFDGNLTLKYNSTISNFSNAEPDDFGHERTPSSVPIDLAINAFGELKNMSRNFSDIRSEMQTASATVDDIIKEFEDAKTSQTEVSAETLDEAIEFMSKLKTQFQQLVADVTKATFQRAVSLDGMIEHYLNARTIPNGILTIHETLDDAPIPNADEIREFAESLSTGDEFLEMAKDYFAERNLHNEGITTIYEAETTTTTATTPGPSTGTGSASSGEKKGLIASLMAWLKGLFSNFGDKAKKISDSVNAASQFIENDFMAIPDNQIISVEAVNVFNINSADIMNGVRATCNAISSESDYSKYDETSVIAAVFPKEVVPKNKDEKLSEKTQYFYTNGGDGKTKENIPASVISTNRKAMFDFCKGYGNTVTTISNEINAAANRISQKLQSEGVGVKTESGLDGLISSLSAIYVTEKGNNNRNNSSRKQHQNNDAKKAFFAQTNTANATPGGSETKSSSPSTVTAGESEADKKAKQESETGNTDTNAEAKKKLIATYESVCKNLQNYISGVMNALKIRANIYYDIIRMVHQHSLKDDRPSSINDQVNKHAESTGMKFYGSKKLSDTQWDCYFYDDKSYSIVKQTFATK